LDVCCVQKKEIEVPANSSYTVLPPTMQLNVKEEKVIKTINKLHCGGKYSV
jgi:hypothetical protein